VPLGPSVVSTLTGSAICTVILVLAGYELGERYSRVASVIEPVSNAVLALAVIWYLWRVATFGRSRGGHGWLTCCPRFLPAFGSWQLRCLSASHALHVPLACSHQPARSSSSVWLEGFTAADFTHGVAPDGRAVGPVYGADRHTGEQPATGFASIGSASVLERFCQICQIS